MSCIPGTRSRGNSGVLCHPCPVYSRICSVQRVHREHPGRPGHAAAHRQDEPLGHAGREAGGAHPGECPEGRSSPTTPQLLCGASWKPHSRGRLAGGGGGGGRVSLILPLGETRDKSRVDGTRSAPPQSPGQLPTFTFLVSKMGITTPTLQSSSQG